MVEIWTANTSGKPQLEKAVVEATRLRREGRNVVVILNQAHQQGADRAKDLQHWAKTSGWAMHVAEATQTERGGWSAGVAALAPRDVPIGIKEGQKTDVSPPGSKGRFVQGWLQQGAPCGLMVGALYLWHTEGPSPRNISLLNRAFGSLLETGCPWVIGLDANDAPRGFETWAKRAIEKAGGCS